MIKEKTTPFSHNIKNFIWQNYSSRRQFADALNEKMACYGEDVKIYTEKDIHGYETRGSCPEDNRALVAMAQIMEKPLEELLTKFFSMNELALPHCNKQPNVLKKWSMRTYNKLTEQEQNFILDLIETELCENNEKFYTALGVRLCYHEGKSVTATVYYGFEGEKELIVEWSWSDYGKEMEELGDEFGEDDEVYLIYRKLEDVAFGKLWQVGLIDDFYCYKADVDGNGFELEPDSAKRFVAVIDFEITRSEMQKLLELIVKRSKKEYKLVRG